VSGDQVDQQAASDGGRDTDEDGRDVWEVVKQGFFHANDREQGVRQGREDDEQYPEPAQQAGVNSSPASAAIATVGR
jgi:hypothetical protein